MSWNVFFYIFNGWKCRKINIHHRKGRENETLRALASFGHRTMMMKKKNAALCIATNTSAELLYFIFSFTTGWLGAENSIHWLPEMFHRISVCVLLTHQYIFSTEKFSEIFSHLRMPHLGFRIKSVRTSTFRNIFCAVQERSGSFSPCCDSCSLTVFAPSKK